MLGKSFYRGHGSRVSQFHSLSASNLIIYREVDYEEYIPI